MKEKKRLSNKDFLLEFFVLFLYIKLHLLQTWRGYKKKKKKCLHTITYTTITTITATPPEWTMIWTKQNQKLWVLFGFLLTEIYDLFGEF